MQTPESRRTSLLGMTLNELVFLLFFLLLIVTAVLLKADERHLQQQQDTQQQLKQQLSRQQQLLDSNFKKLTLQESVLSRLQQAGIGHTPEELDEFFSRLQEVRYKADKLVQVEQQNRRIHQQFQQQQSSAELGEAVLALLREQGGNAVSAQSVEQSLRQLRETVRQQKDLRGQLVYLQKSLQACTGGVDHPPCWADSQDGSIQYLYHIQLHQQGFSVTPAWPPERAADVKAMPGALALAGQTLSIERFKKMAQPVFHWSQQQGCRHFVQVKDDADTSKQAFKDNLLAIESVFYKYLQR
ncbi:MAG: hypothetical protein KZQ58_05575 [gamma proteobacterium symbiont of Bathyaustriella thionipta]|nr:hypothetical protein [gamma proteobacterium symbiont of Bathyaustriella thionipta]